jgi:hypothetical protein
MRRFLLSLAAGGLALAGLVLSPGPARADHYSWQQRPHYGWQHNYDYQGQRAWEANFNHGWYMHQGDPNWWYRHGYTLTPYYRYSVAAPTTLYYVPGQGWYWTGQ